MTLEVSTRPGGDVDLNQCASGPAPDTTEDGRGAREPLRSRLSVAGQSGRLMVVAAILIYALTVFTEVGVVDRLALWHNAGVPGMPPPVEPAFADMRSVTTVWDCTRAGADTRELIRHNSCDPWGRPANYPRLWMLGGYLGLGERATVAAGIANSVVFLLCALLLFPARGSIASAIGFAAILVSPTVLMGVERGNVDLTLYALVGAAALLAFRTRAGLLGGASLLLLASVLKLFPIAGVAMFAAARRGSGRGRYAVAVLVLFAGYCLATFEDIRIIASAIPQATEQSYGSKLTADAFTISFGLSQEHGRFLLLSVFGTCGCLAGLFLKLRPAASDAERARVAAFLAGGAIYLFSYAAFVNWNYRIACLVLVTPQLLMWIQARGAASSTRVAAAIGWVLVFLSTWLHTAPTSMVLVGSAQLLLFGVMAALLVAAARAASSAEQTGHRLRPDVDSNSGPTDLGRSRRVGRMLKAAARRPVFRPRAPVRAGNEHRA